MSFDENRKRDLDPTGDPTMPGNRDGRSRDDARFHDFPDNPDLDGQIRGDPPLFGDRPIQQRRSPGFGTFAPPGELPSGIDQSSVMRGMDGSGGLLMRGPMRPPQVHGDLDMMVQKGIVPPPDGFLDNEMGMPRRPGLGGRGDLGGFGGPGFGRGDLGGFGRGGGGFGGGFMF